MVMFQSLQDRVIEENLDELDNYPRVAENLNRSYFRTLDVYSEGDQSVDSYYQMQGNRRDLEFPSFQSNNSYDDFHPDYVGDDNYYGDDD